MDVRCGGSSAPKLRQEPTLKGLLCWGLGFKQLVLRDWGLGFKQLSVGVGWRVTSRCVGFSFFVILFIFGCMESSLLCRLSLVVVSRDCSSVCGLLLQSAGCGLQ